MITNMAASSSDKVEGHRRLFQAYLDRCNAHDVEGKISFCVSPLTVNDEPWNHSKISESFKTLISAFPDWHWEPPSRADYPVQFR